jgi:hypothetical protein
LNIREDDAATFLADAEEARAAAEYAVQQEELASFEATFNVLMTEF